MVNQYHNSRNFLDKYIRLAGSTGRYYTQAIDLKHYLDQEYEMILVCKLCDNRGYRLTACDVCDSTGKLTSECFYCRGVGVNLCELCKGNGVTTSLNAFREVQYQTCSDCQGKGRTECKVCHGAKVVHEDCSACHGTTKKATANLCDHQPIESNGSSRTIEREKVANN
jgi:DnaJ-class molecular chaperone